MPPYACQLCKQEGHWVSRCPLLQQAALLVAPTMAPVHPPPPPPPPALPQAKPRAYAARIDDDDDDDDDDEDFGGEYLPLVALAGVRGGPGRNRNHPGPPGGYLSTGSIGTNGDQRRLEFGCPSTHLVGQDAGRRARRDRMRKRAGRGPPGEAHSEETFCKGENPEEPSLGFHTASLGFDAVLGSRSDRLLSSHQASTSEFRRTDMWAHTSPTPSPPSSGSSSPVECGYISQYDSDGGRRTPITTGLPDSAVDFYDDPDFPAALLRIEPDQLRTTPPSPRLTSAPSNRQLAADGLPVRAPRFKLVHARHDPYLGPGCPALVGKPAGFRQPHHSDDELGPAISFTAKFKCFHETSEQFSSRVSRAYFAGELSKHAVDSLREDIPALTFLQRLSGHCCEDPSVPFEPRGLVRIHRQLVRAAGLPEDTDFNSETTQQGLTNRQREIARTLTERDSSLPPGMFRHAEFNALRALVAQQDAVRGVSQDAPGRSTEDRELDNVIDE